MGNLSTLSEERKNSLDKIGMISVGSDDPSYDTLSNTNRFLHHTIVQVLNSTIDSRDNQWYLGSGAYQRTLGA